MYIYPELVLEFAQTNMRLSLPQNLNLKIGIESLNWKERKENRKEKEKHRPTNHMGLKQTTALSTPHQRGPALPSVCPFFAR